MFLCVFFSLLSNSDIKLILRLLGLVWSLRQVIPTPSLPPPSSASNIQLNLPSTNLWNRTLKATKREKMFAENQYLIFRITLEPSGVAEADRQGGVTLHTTSLHWRGWRELEGDKKLNSAGWLERLDWSMIYKYWFSYLFYNNFI